jgi:hypothetical protein
MSIIIGLANSEVDVLHGPTFQAEVSNHVMGESKANLSSIACFGKILLIVHLCGMVCYTPSWLWELS